MSDIKRIAVQVELGRAHGRALLEGFSEIASEEREWRPELVDDADLASPQRRREFDAFVVRIMDRQTSSLLKRTRKPVVDVYGRCADSPFPLVNIDDASVAKTAANCLLEHRYVNFAYLGFPGLRFSDDRGEYFSKLLFAHGKNCIVYDGGKTIHDRYFKSEKPGQFSDIRKIKAWLRKLPRPIGVFCCNDLRSLHLARAATEIGLRVPEDIAIIGADNDTAICTFAIPPLSSVDTDSREIGRNAARMLKAMLESGRRTPKVSLPKPNYHVVERVSTDSYPHGLRVVADALVYIRRHLQHGINAQDVFRYLRRSHTTVDKSFRKDLGHGVNAEIGRQRLEYAKTLLLSEADVSIARIAHLCGYSSPQYFCRVFKSQVGTTPDLWKQQQK